MEATTLQYGTVQVVPERAQPMGAFNGGQIQERKPLAFPQEGGPVKAYSNLLYWAHAWSTQGSLLGEHPHKGFEIITYIVEGQIEHYDSHSNAWVPLNAGDIQVMRAGSGLSHAERFGPGSRIFQIWVDPNLDQTMGQAPSYNDHQASQAPVQQFKGYQVLHYAGPQGPMQLDSAGVSIQKYAFEAGNHQLTLSPDQVYSIFVLQGRDLSLNGKNLDAKDFAIVKEAGALALESPHEAELFVVATPAQVPYLTYAQMYL